MSAASTFLLLLCFSILLVSCGQKKNHDSSPDQSVLAKLDYRIGELKSEKPLGLDQMLELGILSQANNRFSDAVTVYKSLLEKTPEVELKSQVTFYLALIDLANGKFDEAESRLKMSVDLFSNAAPAIYKLGELNFKKGKSDDALKWFTRLVEVSYADPYALLGRARANLAVGKRREALADLQKMNEENPSFKGGLGLYAQLLEENGDYSAAARVRSEIVRGTFPPYPHPWLMRLREASYDIKDLGVFYEDYSNAEVDDVAIWFLNRIEELDPQDWNAKVLRGLRYAKEGNTKLALGEYKEALLNGADESFVYPLIIKCLLLLGKTSEAVEFGEKGLSEIPHSVDLLVETAGANMVQFEFERAATYFDAALALDPYHEKALKYYSAMLLKQGDFSNAEKCIERWIQLSPSDAGPYLELATLRLKRGDPASRILAFQERSDIRWTKHSLAKLKELANSLRPKNRRYALRAYEMVNKVDPKDEQALIARVELLVQLKQVASASELIPSLVLLQPNNLAIRIAAGDIYRMNGLKGQAKVEWDAALDLANSDRNKKMRGEVLSRLRSL